MMSFTSFFRRSALAIAILAATGCTALANPSTGRCHIAAQSSMRSAVPADQLGETAYNHVVYSAPFRHATGPLGDDPRSSMRNAVSAEQAGEAEVSHALYTETVADHYRPGDGHASMRSARPASQLGE